jgi:centromere/kinetochore protein ZW10
MWKEILPYSAWASAVGSLVNTVATKIVSDILDMSGMDVDEAEKAAQLITTISKLDDLFIREENILVKNGKEIKATGEVDDRGPIPLTSQFANNWMKMKFLSEVLQSNLAEIRFLWFESELSLYFTKDEVIDLIKLSFEDNPNSRQLIREVKHSAVPITE